VTEQLLERVAERSDSELARSLRADLAARRTDPWTAADRLVADALG